MTDFDFEILEEVARYETGVSQGELQARHFVGYDLTYNLAMLSRIETSGELRVGAVNSACLAERRVPYGRSGSAFLVFYTITDRGKSLLANWKRRRAEAEEIRKNREWWLRFEALVIGVLGSTIATWLYSKLQAL